MPELLVVATPIGNLRDLTPRAAEALVRADLIAAEDTRVTLKLLHHLSVKKPLVSCHRHNERERAEELVRRMLEEDLTVALTCDAGTPAISDPGFLIVRAAREAGIPVTAVCGASAVTAALSVSGFDGSSFAFYGFPPREKKALREKLGAIRKSGSPVAVLYESPHRIVSLVGEIADAWPGCPLCVCSDISKKFERVFAGPCEEVYERIRADQNIEKGEYCLVADLSALPPPVEEDRALTAELYMLHRMLEGDAPEAAFERAARAGYARNALYKARLAIRTAFGEDAR
jgi:16S rRNA (cytidine1402-2'-O)-methyltransferase